MVENIACWGQTLIRFFCQKGEPEFPSQINDKIFLDFIFFIDNHSKYYLDNQINTY